MVVVVVVGWVQTGSPGAHAHCSASGRRMHAPMPPCPHAHRHGSVQHLLREHHAPSLIHVRNPLPGAAGVFGGHAGAKVATGRRTSVGGLFGLHLPAGKATHYPGGLPTARLGWLPLAWPPKQLDVWYPPGLGPAAPVILGGSECGGCAEADAQQQGAALHREAGS